MIPVLARKGRSASRLVPPSTLQGPRTPRQTRSPSPLPSSETSSPGVFYREPRPPAHLPEAVGDLLRGLIVGARHGAAVGSRAGLDLRLAGSLLTSCKGRTQRDPEAREVVPLQVCVSNWEGGGLLAGLPILRRICRFWYTSLHLLLRPPGILLNGSPQMHLPTEALPPASPSLLCTREHQGLPRGAPSFPSP